MTIRSAFLVHPLTSDAKESLALDRKLVEAGNSGFVNWVQTVHRTVSQIRQGEVSENGTRVRVIDDMLDLVSSSGASTHGRLYEISMDALSILNEPGRAMEQIEEAVDMATEWGAGIVGLGSMTGIVGGQGQYISEHASIPVTTGNSLTVYAAVENLLGACRKTGVDSTEETVAVLGIPGSVGTGAARLLSSHCKSLVLVGRSRSSRALRIADELNAEYVTDIPEAIRRARIVFSATSSGQCIDQRWLQPGSVVSDVAVPADVLGTSAARDDVLILTGGLSRIPETMPRSSNFLWFHQGVIPSCLAETLVLGLENHTECYSIGRSLDVERIRRIGKLAEAHGFSFSNLYSFGLPLDDSRLIQFRKHVARRNQSRSVTAGTSMPRESAPTPTELSAQASERWRRYVNPVLMTVADGGFVKTFVRGEGTRVWDHEDNSYLDFVAGYGSVNLGHNHARVVEAVQTALSEQTPGFSPSALNPYAAALADELVTIAPAGLEMASFSNSGTEAVEAALKLARASTGRRNLLYCEQSYHGKTLGALSVTGNPHYQRPFEPLVPDCTAIPYGDCAALENALRANRYAAFIVEPIQGEGGMILPPEGYLREAQNLCQEAGTLLIVDEVQTGMGRTGALFAVDHDDVEPDIMTLAKSLGGGLVPIGATLCRRDVWLQAYGTIQSFMLHSSTFGGGSLACAAGLATVRELRHGDAIDNAVKQGTRLLEGLREICGRTQIARDVRGRGLMIGLEIAPLPAILRSHWKSVVSGGTSEFLVPDLNRYLESVTALYVVGTLMDEYGIYTQVTRSDPSVVRIQPPLTVSSEDVNYFLESIEDVCNELDFCNRVYEMGVSKSVVGQHDSGNGFTPRLPK